MIAPIMSEPSTDPPTVTLYTDGACSGNPGPGGWGYILRHETSKVEKEDSGGDPHTTNNRMEMQACIEGLSALTRCCRVLVISDSKYIVDGMMQWMPNWRANGWRRRQGTKFKPLKNADLWQKLAELGDEHEVTFEHGAGHAGHPENERCDELAVQACKAARPR